MLEYLSGFVNTYDGESASLESHEISPFFLAAFIDYQDFELIKLLHIRCGFRIVARIASPFFSKSEQGVSFFI
jgi:hypothetical protein